MIYRTPRWQVEIELPESTRDFCGVPLDMTEMIINPAPKRNEVVAHVYRAEDL
jgi:hypothetical protein